MPADHIQRRIREVSNRLGRAEALLITAGAGMSVDSGLPDFRGNHGFWRAYPPLGKLGISFERMAQPYWFTERPAMAWAWYGHRARLYREATPHPGYRILREWLQVMPAGGFVVTSNVDGQFLEAGFEARGLYELHGSIHHLQCVTPCSDAVWPADLPDLRIDLDTLHAAGELPRCPNCGALARPNVLMFNDMDWVEPRAREQGRRFDHWLARVRDRRLVILEIGAGSAVPTIRRLGERIAQRNLATLVRCNPDSAEADDGIIALPMGALEALGAIDEARRSRRVHAAGLARSGAMAPTRAAERTGDVPAPPRGQHAAPRATIRLRLGEIACIDLETGGIELAWPQEVGADDGAACLFAFADHPSGWFPVPATSVHSPCGYQMRLIEFGAGNAALIAIISRDDDAVLTIGVARNSDDGGAIWHALYRTALSPLQPLECPRAPWIARRLDTDSPDHRAMVPELMQVGRIAAIAWLKFKAFEDWQRENESDD
ncbi:MAG: Sir2 family NAD-dependent protein deacetylase [Steroidobacteraceae bacterium]